MDVTKHIICELTGYKPVTVDVSQGDRGSRAVSCRLLENGAPWMIPEGAAVRVAYTLPDGTEGLYDALPDGSPAGEIAGNTVTVALADQIMDQAGMVQMSILIIGPAGGQLATWPIRVMVMANKAARLTVPENLPPYGAGFAGKLFYGGADGTVTPLALGDGVEIVRQEDGSYALMACGGGAVAEHNASETAHPDIRRMLENLLPREELPEAIENALAQAKESGEFDGPRGPQGDPGPAGADGPPGDDYVLTDADRQEIAELAAGLVEVPNVKPLAKTADMTQPVGVDDEGRLWSAPLTVNIPEGGGGTWELIGEITSDGTGNSAGLAFPVNFSEWRELFITVKTVANAKVVTRLMLSKLAVWYNGQVLVMPPYGSESFLYQCIIKRIGDKIYPFAGYNSGFSQSVKALTPIASPRDNFLHTDFNYIRVDTNNNAEFPAVEAGTELKVWGCR